MTPTTRLPLVAASLRIADADHSQDGTLQILTTEATALEAAAFIEKQGALVAQLADALEGCVERMDGEYGFGDPVGKYGALILAARTLGERE